MLESRVAHFRDSEKPSHHHLYRCMSSRKKTVTRKTLGRPELRQFLESLSTEQLVDEIAALVDRFPQVKEYYKARILPDGDRALREGYKAIIGKEFSENGRARLGVARKAVVDYKRVAGTVEGIVDLMLYYVEADVRYTATFGDMDERFYDSMEGMYHDALQKTSLHGLFRCRDRCRAVVEGTSNVGWGFHDALPDMYETYVARQKPGGDAVAG